MSNIKESPEITGNNNMDFNQAISFEKSSMPELIKSIVRKGRPKSKNPKIAISIRLSSEVVEFFKATGRGWQTRMDEVLQNYVAEH